MFRCLLLFSLICLSTVAHAQNFLQGTEDVPLMTDFEVCNDDTFSFEDGEGRLFFSKALTSKKSEEILDFYNQTLPALGWTKNEKGFFEREGDVLKIAVWPDDGDQNGVFFELIAK